MHSQPQEQTAGNKIFDEAINQLVKHNDSKDEEIRQLKDKNRNLEE